MHYVKIKNGKVDGSPKPLSGSPSDSPNIYWGSEQLAIHGYALVDLANQKIESGEIKIITAQEKQDAEILAANKEAENKNTRRAKRDEDLALMDWDKQKLKALKRLISSDDE